MDKMKSKTKRMIKTDSEILKLRKAVLYTEGAIAHAMKSFRKGMSEKDIAEIIKSWAHESGLGTGFILVQGDQNSASIHGKPTNRKIKRILLLDINLIYKGYHGDVTRTYLLNPTAKMKKIYSLVKKAYDKSVEGAMQGRCCKEVDGIARKIIQNAGFKFKHSLGHGVGLRIHEFPRIGMKSRHCFQKGMVFTIEPGIYLKKKFGVRIEDVFVANQKPKRLGRLGIPEYD
jgi:Xaa-Pro aminopeptidase